MEGVVDLRSPLLVPDAVDSLQPHHNAVNICNGYVFIKKVARLLQPSQQHPRNREIAVQCVTGEFTKSGANKKCLNKLH